MRAGTIRQILILTDGQSNVGENPVAMASVAADEGITVNVIGVVQKNDLENEAQREIESIAKAGKGVSQIVFTKQLSQTVQMVTRKAMTQTLHGLMNKELRQILGSNNRIEDLPPEKRMEVVEIMDDYSEKVHLEVAILVDTSGSMKDKISMVKESLLDLSISLDSRLGENMYTVFTFPGKHDNVECILDWTSDIKSITRIFPKLTLGGMTPTGPAIQEAVYAFLERKSITRGYISNDELYIDKTEY